MLLVTSIITQAWQVGRQTDRQAEQASQATRQDKHGGLPASSMHAQRRMRKPTNMAGQRANGGEVQGFRILRLFR